MNKTEFLSRLKSALTGLPEEDIAERIEFYSEIIDDRIEEGMSEEEAVSKIGTIDEVKAQILSDIPFPKIIKDRIKPKRKLSAIEIVLIILGFPVWFPVIVSLITVALSLYVVVLSLIISLWAVFLSLAITTVAGIIIGVFYCTQKDYIRGVMLIGASLCIAGVSIFVYYGCLAATKGIIKLTKKAGIAIKSLFVGKEKTK
ncbi:MAG: DUF1700 domain-containing protein [Clostridia bacterium]|nr:DUF1700 domain-containing protein [Clostridia bacterium]